MRRLVFVVGLTVFLAWGFAPREGADYRVWPQISKSFVAPPQSAGVKREFVDRYGGNWSFIWNRDTGLPHRIVGSGVYVGQPKDEAEAIEKCLAFATENPEIFPPQCELVPISAKRALGTWIVTFREEYDGLPVLSGRADFRIKRGKLVLLGSDLHPNLAVDVEPSLGLDDALRIAAQRFEFEDAWGELWVSPFEGGRLLWRISAQNEAPVHRWQVFVDAHTGEIVYFWDDVPTAIGGRVFGELHPLYALDSVQTLPLPNIWVWDEHGDSVLADEEGNYLFEIDFVYGTIIYGKLVGLYADVVPVSGVHSVCGGGATSEVFDLTFASDCAALDEVGAFYHVNVVHRFFKSIDPDFVAMDYPVPVTVSDTVDPCPLNAFWDGHGIHLGAGGGGTYRNFGLYADVIYHEYTHGTTHFIYPIDLLPYVDQPGALNEAFSDYFACAITGEPYIGELGLVIGQPWMRSLDNDLRYPDDWVDEVHADSRIISGAWWDIRDALLSRKGWVDSLVHFTRFTFANTFDDFAYEMLVLDDDDGNLINGTPHDDEIIEGYMRHGIGGFGVRILHKPHKDTENTLEPYRIRAELRAFTPVRWAFVYYSVDGSTFTAASLEESDTSGVWEAFIPPQPSGTTVRYYIWAEDWRGFSDTLPDFAPETLFAFHVGPDTVPPSIVHKPLWDQSEYTLPYRVLARIEDNCEAPVGAFVVFGRNSAPAETVAMEALEGDVFGAEMDFPGGVEVGDSIWYCIWAYDGASEPNYAANPDSGVYSFRVVRSIYYDFEGGDGGFSSELGWEWGEPTSGPGEACSGTMLWATVLGGNYGDNADYLLVSPPIDLSGFSDALLSFSMWLESERRYDGGQVLVSTDGDHWELLEPVGGYPTRAVAALGGEPGFSGATQRWVKPAFDLSPYLGSTVQIAFRFASDGAVNMSGWYVDDVLVLETNLLLPPKNFRAESGYDGVVPLYWQKPSEGVIEYLLYRSTVDEQPAEPYAHISADDTLYMDYDVVNGTRYYYWLVARYRRGDSEPAGPVDAAPFAARIAVEPESLFIALNPGGMLDTAIVIHNLGMGELSFDIWEAPYGDACILSEGFLEPSADQWHLLAVDPAEGVPQDIAALWGQTKTEGTNKAYFLVCGYGTFGDPDSFVVAWMFDTDLNPSTGFPEGGGIEYIVAVGNVMGFDGMILRYNPESPYGWDIIGVPSWIYRSTNQDTVGVGFSVSNLGSPDAAYMRCAIMTGLAGTTPEVMDIVPDTTAEPVEFSFYNARWIVENPIRGDVSGGESERITLSIDSHGLSSGYDYRMKLRILSNDRTAPEVFVPVVLRVVPWSVDDVSKPSGLVLFEPRPVPFNAAVELGFFAAEPADVRLAVYDVAGRCVRVLLDGAIAAGSHRIVWDGTDGEGEPLPSGVYLLRLSAEGASQTKRLLLVR